MADAGNFRKSRKMAEVPASHESAISKLRHCALFGGVLLSAASMSASPAEAATAPVHAVSGLHMMQKNAATALVLKPPVKTVGDIVLTSDTVTSTLPADLSTLQSPTATQQQVAAALADLDTNFNPILMGGQTTASWLPFLSIDWNGIVNALAQNVSAYGSPSALGTLDSLAMQNLQLAMNVLGNTFFANVIGQQHGVPFLPQSAFDTTASTVIPFTNPSYASFPSFESAYYCLFSVLNAELAGQAPPAACSGAASALLGIIQNATDQSQIAGALAAISGNLSNFVGGDTTVVSILSERVSAYGSPSTLNALSVQNLQSAMVLLGSIISTNASMVIQGVPGVTILPQSALDTAANAVAPFAAGPPSVCQAALNCFSLILGAEPMWQAPPVNACNMVFPAFSGIVMNGGTGKILVALLANISIPVDSGFVDKLKARYDSLAAGNPQKEALGGCITAACFTNPALAGMPAYNALLGLDSATIAAMVAQSPSWNLNGPYAEPAAIVFGYYQKIYDISQAYPGLPVAKTLFNDNNITLFTNYPDDVIKHLYYDRTTVSGKPIVFMVFTKRPNTVNFGSIIFPVFDYDSFDIRAIEPGTNVNMASLMDSTSARLGGKKFSWLIVNGHGYAEGVVLKALADASGDNPMKLDISDSVLLKQVKPLFILGPYVILNACATAGSNAPDANLAQVVAEYLDAICWGATAESGGVQSIAYTDLGGGVYIITNVVFNAAGTGVYDDRQQTKVPGRTHPLSISVPSVRHEGSTYIISAANGTECIIYDLAGRAIAKLGPDAQGRFIWNSSGAAAGMRVARILVKEGNAIDVKYLGFNRTR